MGRGPGRRLPPAARRPGQTLTRLGGSGQAALRIPPVEAAEARRRGGLVRPVQVAAVPQAACEEEEPPSDTQWGTRELGALGSETLGPWKTAQGLD